MTLVRPKYDLKAFVEEMVERCGHAITLTQAVAEVDHEIEVTKAGFSRDHRTRFEQVRYVNSLTRLEHFLAAHEVPADLTPRERLAIRNISMVINGGVPASLADAFMQVTLPTGVFGQSFELRNRVA